VHKAPGCTETRQLRIGQDADPPCRACGTTKDACYLGARPDVSPSPLHGAYLTSFLSRIQTETEPKPNRTAT